MNTPLVDRGRHRRPCQFLRNALATRHGGLQGRGGALAARARELARLALANSLARAVPQRRPVQLILGIFDEHTVGARDVLADVSDQRQLDRAEAALVARRAHPLQMREL